WVTENFIGCCDPPRVELICSPSMSTVPPLQAANSSDASVMHFVIGLGPVNVHLRAASYRPRPFREKKENGDNLVFTLGNDRAREGEHHGSGSGSGKGKGSAI